MFTFTIKNRIMRGKEGIADDQVETYSKVVFERADQVGPSTAILPLQCAFSIHHWHKKRNDRHVTMTRVEIIVIQDDAEKKILFLLPA